MTRASVFLVAALLVIGAACGAPSGPYFTSPMFFDRDVSRAPVAGDSAAIVAALDDAGGWGNGNRFAIDFSIDVLAADAATPRMAFTPTSDWTAPDCDNDAVPIPASGDVEGEDGYACTQNGDCHLIVFDRDASELFEMWRANLVGGTFEGGCLAVWRVGRSYGDALRGNQCTSADAAGLPIAPLLFTADEVAAGSIDHAIRFVLPNDRVRRGFVRPATHATDTTGSSTAPYFGVHLRLRADYPVESLPSAGAKVVARALQTYGMIHADGGEVALTAQSDRHTTAKWPGLLAGSDLAALTVDDFEVIDHGAAIALTYDCVRD